MVILASVVVVPDALKKITSQARKNYAYVWVFAIPIIPIMVLHCKAKKDSPCVEDVTACEEVEMMSSSSPRFKMVEFILVLIKS